MDNQAILDHEAFKKNFEERQDELIRDSPSKRVQQNKKPAMMSGALGQLPQSGGRNGGASNLVPDPPDSNTPPPWNDEGPPAVKIRMSVSSGYYIRSFCHDLGTLLGSAALMSELSRTRQSDFTVGGLNCLEYEDLGKDEAVWGPKIADMLARWNGEPEGTYDPSAKSSQAKGANVSAPSNAAGEDSSPARDARKRSRSPRSASDTSAPPRKVQARGSPGRTQRPRDTSASERRKSDSEKSWKGIED